ncbi:glycerol-3-phosphate dehydrogenase C-terminal domain-containing protein [Yoonia sp. MH D7]
MRALTYGALADDLMGDAEVEADFGTYFNDLLSAREVDWLMAHEFALTAEDAVWRRTKLGFRMTSAENAAVDAFMKAA